MKSIFTIDGRSFNVTVPEDGLKRQGRILDGKNAGRSASGIMERDIVGTYYNYSMEIDTRNLDVKEYDDLYEILSAPVSYHNITIPYGQGTLSFKAYVSNVDDTLKCVRGDMNLWGGLAFTFVAIAPSRR